MDNKQVARKATINMLRDKEWNGHCQRCFKKTLSHTMSWFDTSLICNNCSDKEADHSRYKEAREAEERAVRSGNYNFKGIGYFIPKQ